MIQKPAKPDPSDILLCAWLLLFLAIFIGAIAAFDIAQKLRASSWLVVGAEVLSSDIYQRTGKSHAWCARVRYGYTVAGRAYQGDQRSQATISSAGCRRDRAKVEAKLATLPKGTPISIYYDPAYPSHAAIELEQLSWFDYLLSAMALWVFVSAVRWIRVGSAGMRELTAALHARRRRHHSTRF